MDILQVEFNIEFENAHVVLPCEQSQNGCVLACTNTCFLACEQSKITHLLACEEIHIHEQRDQNMNHDVKFSLMK